VIEMLLRSRPSASLGNPHSGKRQTSTFAIFYGVGLTVFLFVALSQATDVLADYLIELLVCSIIGGLSIYGQLLSLQREASIHFISFVFCFLFMSIAPIVQLGADADQVFRMDHWAFWSALNAMQFTAIGVFFTYRLKKPDNKVLSTLLAAPSDYNYFFAFLVTAVSAGVAIALLGGSLFTNREEFNIATGALFQDQAIASLVMTLLSSLPFFGAIIGLRSSIANGRKIWIALFSFGMLMAAIVNNPLVHARYQLAGLAFFAVDYMFYGKKTKLLAVLLVAGVLAAPIFQSFRYELSDNKDNLGTVDNKLFGKTFLSMDYDAYAVSCYTMLTVDNDGIAWGSNVLGAVLFFVPRALWPEKPPQTSWVIFETIDHTRNPGTNNLSTPLMAEGYYAFGWIGALLTSVLYWWFISRTTLLSRKDFNSWAFLARCLFAGLALIFLRGTLIVGVSAVVGSLGAAAIPAFLLFRFRRGSRRVLPIGPVRGQQSFRAPSDQRLYP
jgi:hypothetical protein